MLSISVIALLAAAATVPTTNSTPKELGLVRWQRDLPAALATAKETGKPVMVLFQEVPGCLTCQRFGTGPLSHFLLVEAMETEFVPVLVYNNKSQDTGVLKKFGEPAMNNPVVRFLDADSRDLIPRKDGVWTTGGIAQRMVAALEAARRPVPKYLALVAEETSVAQPAQMTFTMDCFWSGEARLGSLPGVLATRAGWTGKSEAVEVTYDPQRVTVAKLVEEAGKMQCAKLVLAHTTNQLAEAKSVASDRAVLLEKPAGEAEKDTKYYVKHTRLAKVPLTELQATRVNSALAQRRDPLPFLSPRQIAQLPPPSKP